ncbi:MAG: AIR synthase-related protein, partial [Puniceicoccales bacterium]
KVMHDLNTGAVPAVDLEGEKRLTACVLAQISAGRVKAAHDLSEGGLLTAVADMLVAPGKTFGAMLDLASMADKAGRLDELLYGESQGRVLLSVSSNKVESVLDAATDAGIPAVVIGEVQEEPTLSCKAEDTLSWDVEALRTAWETSIEQVMAH